MTAVTAMSYASDSRLFWTSTRPFGRESIPPEQLLRALLLQALCTIRSERQLVERVEFDLLFRWFVGLGVDDPVLDGQAVLRDPVGRGCQ